MVACTFISAPLMFVSAKMITITNTNPSQYINELNAFTFDISIVSTICCLWVILVFVLSKKINKIPHKITTFLIVSQVRKMFDCFLFIFVRTQSNVCLFPSIIVEPNFFYNA